jgi:hypothetical protein
MAYPITESAGCLVAQRLPFVSLVSPADIKHVLTRLSEGNAEDRPEPH